MEPSGGRQHCPPSVPIDELCDLRGELLVQRIELVAALVVSLRSLLTGQRSAASVRDLSLVAMAPTRSIPGGGGGPRWSCRLAHLQRRRPVSGKVVVTAELVVVHPRRRRDRGVDPEQRRATAGHADSPSRPKPGMVKLHRCSWHRRVSIAGQPHADDNLRHHPLVTHNESL